MSRGIRDEKVLKAMGQVPRERFVDARFAQFAYEDTPLPIEAGQTLPPPFVIALIAEALELTATCRVLEIGAGSGYAAAVSGRIAAQVFAIERHATLARDAQARVQQLGYVNVHVRQGDGALGWPEYGPYDAIAVTIAGLEVPPSLLDQLAIGGRLVIPIGHDPTTQALLRIRRLSADRFEREPLGQINHNDIVPSVGAVGASSADAKPVSEPAPGPPASQRFKAPRSARSLPQLVADHAEPIDTDDLDGIEGEDISRLLARIGDSRVVLIGEATHGTSEFYRMRARITRALIVKAGFTVVGIEGDWPDTNTLDRQVRQRAPLELRQAAFTRFPTWMWRNRETHDFIEWLTDHNRSRAPERKVSLHGLDVYGLHNSIGLVLDYLDRVDPYAADLARVRYGCFSPWEADPTTYGRVAVDSSMHRCEDEAVAVLTDLLERRVKYAVQDGDELMDAERAAAVVKNAERYYRIMYYGGSGSWNLRDRHMLDTLEAVRCHRGRDTKAVVWAHNSHVGNASATEMGGRGEINIGQLARRLHGRGAYAIGLGTDRGTVAAASGWDGPMQMMQIPGAHVDSYERICHETGLPAFMLPLREPESLRRKLLEPHLERAIGVVYRPQTELLSHYFHAALSAQFDEYLWFDHTHAVEAIDRHPEPGVPETYPFGL